MSKKNSHDNVLPFRKSKAEENTEALKLMRIADEIDAVLLKHLHDEDINIHDLAGALSHRLGTLLRHLEAKKTLWPVYERVLKKQAAID